MSFNVIHEHEIDPGISLHFRTRVTYSKEAMLYRVLIVLLLASVAVEVYMTHCDTLDDLCKNKACQELPHDFCLRLDQEVHFCPRCKKISG